MDRPFFEPWIGENYENGGLFGKKFLHLVTVIIVTHVKSAVLQVNIDAGLILQKKLCLNI